MPTRSNNQTGVVARTADYVRETLAGDAAGHDWWHVLRVWNVAKCIADEECADQFVVQLAALLHDIADWKFHAGDETAGPRAARVWLTDCAVDRKTIDHVCEIIAQLSFKGAGVADQTSSIEGRVVQDADRLDALGAIGIARAFAYGGHKGRAMYDPAISPERHESFEAYKKSSGPTINHFYEKLLLLKDRMQTAAGRRMAAERHGFMEQFLEQFFREWNFEPGQQSVR
jgi:uncharacterized protein